VKCERPENACRGVFLAARLRWQLSARWLSRCSWPSCRLLDGATYQNRDLPGMKKLSRRGEDHHSRQHAHILDRGRSVLWIGSRNWRQYGERAGCGLYIQPEETTLSSRTRAETAMVAAPTPTSRRLAKMHLAIRENSDLLSLDAKPMIMADVVNQGPKRGICVGNAWIVMRVTPSGTHCIFDEG
jgi:hypothetical protein